MPTLYVLQGHPGSGKSTFAKKLLQESADKKICIVSADYYFEDEEGVYRFDPKLIREAHRECRQSAFHFMDAGYSVIVDNTNTMAWEVKPYVKYALDRGMEIQFIRLHGNYPNIHGVPEHKVREMKSRLEELTLENILKE